MLFGLPNASTQTVDYAVMIPNGLSLLLHGDPQAVVPGLDQIPRQDWPPVAVTHVAFQLMVGCGLIMAGTAMWAGLRRWQGRLEQDRRLLRTLVVIAPLGFIAIQAGWVVTEVGRQPWIIQGLMRTSKAVTPIPGLWIPMVTFSVLYLVLAGVVVWAIRRHIAAADVASSSEERLEGRGLPALLMNTFAAIADPLFRQACGRRTRPSGLRRTARVRLRSSGLRTPISRRGLAISRRTVMNNAG